MKNKITIIETLKREVSGTIEDVERKYKNSEIVLDAGDFVSVEITDNKYTALENAILNEIHNFCTKECGNCKCCVEEECVLFRIEKLITKEGKS